jgi:hypothetical protein
MSAALVLATAGTLSAEVIAPRVIASGQPDAIDLASLARHPDWAPLDNASFAQTVLMWLTDEFRGVTIVERGPSEGVDKTPEFAAVADPLKTLAVYGYGDRRAVCGALAALWEASGRGRARLAMADGQLVAELQIDGEWRAFDVAARTSLSAAASQLRYHAVPTGHTLSFALRRGERFTQFFQPQGERWQAADSDTKDAKLRTFWDQPPRGPKSSGDTPRPLYSHGRFVYEPLLKGSAADFLDGVYDFGNVEVTADGLTVQRAGEGFAIFQVQSPYVIVAELNKLEDPKDNKDASVAELDGADITAMYSRDYGATWLSLETKSFPARLDLSSQVAGGYGYLLRIDFKGQPGKSVLRSLKMETWVQLAPGLLPAVKTGQNKFAFKTGDADGRATLPVVIDASTADENGFLRPVIRPPREFRPGDASRRVIGPFTARIAAPPHCRIAWLSVGGSFACDVKDPASAQASIGMSLEGPANFHVVELPKLPADHSWEHYHLDVPIRIGAPAAAVYFRGEGRPALNQWRMTAHCVRETPRSVSPVQITHRWTEAAAAREHAVQLTGGGDYALDAGNDVANVSIEFAVPGGAATP